MTSRLLLGCLVSLVVALCIALVAFAMVASLFAPSTAAACRQTPREPYNPTGWEGCARYGSGIASRWPGPGVARNDCVYPWTSCQRIRITSHQTGISIIVRPTMFCDCYLGGHGSYEERLVDLDPAAVAALGLEWAAGLYPVSVEPVDDYGHPADLPDTALAP